MNFQGFSVFTALVLAASVNAVRAETVERVEAIVNKAVVYKSDVDRFKKLIPLRLKVDPFFASDPLSKKQNPDPAEVVDYLVNEKLILDKFPVNDSEVETEITGIQNNLHIDRDGLKQAINREGFKFEDYFAMMRASIAKRQLIDHDIRNKATVSDDDLRAEYNRGKATSKSFRGSFHIYLIRITKKNFKTTALAKQSATAALADLSAGKEFKSVAEKYSDDGTSSSGGDLGYLSYSEMSPTLQKEVQKLGPGKTSGLIDNGKSYEIIKVEDIKADVDAGFDREKDALRAKLLEGEFHHQIGLWLDRQRAQNFVKINKRGT
ncbi:MAG: peptidylprolyl isomerase [Bdellovibrionales bacterium]|nr:peptidylprolyl isomerase [Bdellovibrionales bacterium]